MEDICAMDGDDSSRRWNVLSDVPPSGVNTNNKDEENEEEEEDERGREGERERGPISKNISTNVL